MHLSTRIATVLEDAGLTARDLSAATLIHFTSIYKMLREGEAHTFTPRTESALHRTLCDIERLRTEGKLPILEPIRAEERSQRLLTLLATVRN